jgi:hypothetical protein
MVSMLFALATVLGLAAPALADEVVDGSTGPGSVYRLVRPTNWNGILLLYAHGYVSKDVPVAIPPDAQLVVSLLAPQGFAVAVSSFSENGWVLRTARAHQLLGLFTSTFGKPARVYAAGASMGGLIAIRLIESWPGEFAGVLPACAVAGGLARQVDFMANVRVLFDLFYPGVLPGTAVDVPPGIDVIQDIVNPAVAAMTVDPTGAFAIASIAQTPVQFASGPSSSSRSRRRSAEPRLSGNPRLTHGQAYFDNTATRCTEPSLTDARVHQRERPAFSGTPPGRTRWSTTTRRRAISGCPRSHSRRSAIRSSRASTAPFTARRSRPMAVPTGLSSARSRGTRADTATAFRRRTHAGLWTS